MGEISESINEALPTTEPPYLMAIHCAVAERGVLIKKKEKKERKLTSKA